MQDGCAVEQPVFSAQKAKILFHEGASPIEAMQPSRRRGTRAPTSERAPHCLTLSLGDVHVWWSSVRLLGRHHPQTPITPLSRMPLKPAVVLLLLVVLP